jgi:hypothetical protein
LLAEAALLPRILLTITKEQRMGEEIKPSEWLFGQSD